MKVIETTAPISIEYLKDFFTNKDNTSFLIDYENSQLKGSKVLIYLSNLDVPSNLKVDILSDSFKNLISDYLNIPFILNLEILEKETIKILLRVKGIIDDTQYDKFIEDNRDILDRWVEILDSLPLYNIFSIESDELKSFVKEMPKRQHTDLKGINFVSLLKHPEFYLYYQNWSIENSKYFENYFNDYMFKGKNLYSYWANEKNPMFLLTFGIVEGISSQDTE